MGKRAKIIATSAVVLILVSAFMLLSISTAAITLFAATQEAASIAASGSADCASNDSSDDSDSSYANQALIASFKNNENAAYVAEALLESKGVDLKGLKFSRTMVAAFLGNWSVESGVAFKRVQMGRNASDDWNNDTMEAFTINNTRDDADVGLGIAQWTWNPGRAGNLIETARSMGKQWYDREPQMQLLINELNGSYRNSVYEVIKSQDVDTATMTVLHKYEGIENGTVSQRQAAAKEWLQILKDKNIGTDSVDDAQTTNGTSDDEETVCEVETDSISYSSAGGAPTDTNNFAWMCDSNQKICTASDAGVFYPHLELGHQCVWYLWNRLAMIHGNSGWKWVQGDGGAIWANLVGKQSWEVSDAPQPGDGVSGSGGAFTSSDVRHVAVVEEVRTDSFGWKIRISEGNTDGSASFNSYSSRWLTKANAGNVHFFRNKSWAK